MKIYRNIEEVREREVVLTIGTFDGVHLAHRALISSIVEEAHATGRESMLMTFSPHPRTFVSTSTSKPIGLLSTTTEKVEYLRETGLDILLVQTFDRRFSEVTAEDFIEHHLVAALHPSQIIIGYDHKFGKNRSGDIQLLRDYAAEGDYEVREIPKIILDDLSVNSTQIREYLYTGEVDKANQLLGRPYSMRGTVVRGLQNGRKLGYPTANIKPEHKEKLVPRDGVYKVDVRIGEECNRGALNIGNRPSIDQTLTHTIEVYILDFDEDIYGREVQLYFLDFIRPELRFDSVDALRAQIAQDVEAVSD